MLPTDTNKTYANSLIGKTLKRLQTLENIGSNPFLRAKTYLMLPTDPNKTYTHKSSKRKFRVSGDEKLLDTMKWINGSQKYKKVLSIVYLDNKELEAWLIGYNDEFIRVVEHKAEPDENENKILIKIESYD